MNQVISEEVYIAKNGFLTKEGWQFLLMTAHDILINKSNIRALRKVMENDDIPAPEIKLVEIWPYEKRPTCRKCGTEHMTGVRIYLPFLNAMKTICVGCGAKWLEKCKDRSEPTTPYKSMPENKSVSPNPFERFMIKLRNRCGDSAVLYSTIQDHITGGLTVHLEWEFRTKRLTIRRCFSSQELDYIMENHDSLEGFFNIFYPELERMIQKVEDENDERINGQIPRNG